jgi:tRNA nucleotidyltransferase/poly(A) polymerase
METERTNETEKINEIEQTQKQESIPQILEYIEKASCDIFELIKEQKYKESAEKLEKALFKMRKIFYLLQNYEKNDLQKISKKLHEVKEKFQILKRYYEIMVNIENEAMENSFKKIKGGSIVNKKT